MSRPVVSLTALGGVLALGCAATTGSAWVRQPEPGPFADDAGTLAVSDDALETFDEPARSYRTPDLPRDEQLSARPRLDRTITLGETVAATSERSAEPGAADPAPVSITINHYVTSPRDGAGYLGVLVHDGGAGTRAPVRPLPRARPAPPTRPGQDWPALPSYGPAFPFKTAPASPWAPDR